MHKVTGGVQNYAWGKLGRASCISDFISNPDPSLPYAEYWLGTHPSLPSSTSSGPLSNLTGALPYLFKLLSIAKPLSIQVHPSKTQAESLHSSNPILYPDNNYKPEMCIAKSKMKLFIGFRPLNEIQTLLETTPELLRVVGVGDLKTQLQNLYLDEGLTRNSVKEYCERVRSGVYYEVNSHFPEDPGVFFAMFMNYVELNIGEGVVIDAGVPHCYIEGDCFEAMACSDNVVRAGLTPKPKDVGTLLEIMNYSSQYPKIVRPAGLTDNIEKYESGYQEFQLFRYFGTGKVGMGTGKFALGVVCEGNIRYREEVFGPGEGFLIENFVEAELQSACTVVCCEGNTS